MNAAISNAPRRTRVENYITSNVATEQLSITGGISYSATEIVLICRKLQYNDKKHRNMVRKNEKVLASLLWKRIILCKLILYLPKTSALGFISVPKSGTMLTKLCIHIGISQSAYKHHTDNVILKVAYHARRRVTFQDNKILDYVLPSPEEGSMSNDRHLWWRHSDWVWMQNGIKKIYHNHVCSNRHQKENNFVQMNSPLRMNCELSMFRTGHVKGDPTWNIQNFSETRLWNSRKSSKFPLLASKSERFSSNIMGYAIRIRWAVISAEGLTEKRNKWQNNELMCNRKKQT